MSKSNNSGKSKITQRLHYFSIGSKPGKIAALDGLRAIAILMVLCFHFATYYREHHGSYFTNLFPEITQKIMFNGWLGVDLFFVLSGYLIFHHLISASKNKQPLSLSRYALKRILRTFPLYYAIILLIGFGLIPFYHTRAENTAYWIHLFFLQDYLGASLLTPLWSLATEEKFYLLAPLFWLALQKHSPKNAVILLTLSILALTIIKAIAIYHAQSIPNYVVFFSEFRAPFHYAITSILIGIMVALLSEQSPQIKTSNSLIISATLVILTTYCLSNLYRTPSWQWVNFAHLVITFYFGLLVWHAIKHSGAKCFHFLTGRFLRIISVLSYALYISHYAVLPWTNKLHKTYIQSEEAWIHAGAFFAIYLTLSILFSLGLHYAIEKPFLILKSRL